MKFPKQAELEKLIGKIQKQEALSAEELADLTQLNTELSNWKNDSIEVLNELVQKIVSYGITLDQLCARAELKHWSAQSVNSPRTSEAAGKEAEDALEGEAPAKKRRPRTVNPELVIFKIQPPNAKGAPTSIHRGELPLKMGAKLEWLVQQEGDLEAKLMACADSDEARTYLANQDGREFMDKLLNWIKSQQA